MKTKGALYKHYKNKRDIFDSILERVCQLDLERSQKAGVPENDFDKMPQPFHNTTVESGRQTLLSATIRHRSGYSLTSMASAGLAITQAIVSERSSHINCKSGKSPAIYMIWPGIIIRSQVCIKFC